MGYTTDFAGELTLTPAASPEQVAYINTFNRTRRMRRDAAKLEGIADPVREAAGLPIGIEGAFFVGYSDDHDQAHSADVLDYNAPPGTVERNLATWDADKAENEKRVEAGTAQPGLWCQWQLSDDGVELSWDEGEKFYEYVPWLKYMIASFFEPWGIKLNGEIEWTGEENGDVGKIVVTDNAVKALEGRIVYE